MVIQNYNVDNYPLNLDNQLLTKILGDYAMLCIENYSDIYPDSNEHGRKGITAIGLSSLYFDKYYFTNYLTQASIIYSLKKENETENVNVEEAVKLSQEVLKKNQNIVEDFLNWQKNIILNANIEDGSVDKCNVELSKGFTAKVNEFRDSLLSILNDPTTSLKLKRAALAELLGKEDRLIIEKSISRNNLTIDDCNAVALQEFVDANNEHVITEKDEKGNVKVSVNGFLPAFDNEGKADLKIEEMRALRESILESSRDIRNTKKEIDSLGIQKYKENKIQNSIDDDGFHIGDNTYKLLNKIEPEKFEIFYEPHDCDHFQKFIDLRNYFTPIKDQGNVGTCTVFAVTSIFEYILKKSEEKDYDLSEHFIYYNIQESEDSKREKGTSYNDVIGVFKSIGICKEETCPYSPNTVNIKPSDLAYQEAQSNKIFEAKGVKIKHDDIISALNDGYPVGISLRIFESLCNNGGTVFMPSAKEISNNTPMYHAMVICGYSLDDNIYIVRNSWGDKVGDNGYFYIPFEYIENENLNISACIITSINGGEETKGISLSKNNIFNNIDSHIRLAVLQKALKKEEKNYEELNKKYEALRANYEAIFKELDKGSVRDKIIKFFSADKHKKVDSKNKDIEIIKNDKKKIIEECDSKILKSFRICASFGLLFIILWFVGLHFSDSFMSWLKSDLNIILVIAFVIDILINIVIVYFIKNKFKDKINENSNKLSKEEKEKDNIISVINSIDLKYNYLGRFIENFYEIDRIVKEKYCDIVSFVDNLDKWLLQEENVHSQMLETKSNDIFIPVISNVVLDTYFDNNKDVFTQNLHLYKLLENYDSRKETALVEIQDSIRKIINNKINELLSGFSLFKHISEQEKYLFLENSNIGVNKISRLEIMSKVFFKLRCVDDSSQYIFLDTKDLNSYGMNDKITFSKKTSFCNTTFKNRIIFMQKGDYNIGDFLNIKDDEV